MRQIRFEDEKVKEVQHYKHPSLSLSFPSSFCLFFCLFFTPSLSLPLFFSPPFSPTPSFSLFLSFSSFSPSLSLFSFLGSHTLSLQVLHLGEKNGKHCFGIKTFMGNLHILSVEASRSLKDWTEVIQQVLSSPPFHLSHLLFSPFLIS